MMEGGGNFLDRLIEILEWCIPPLKWRNVYAIAYLMTTVGFSLSIWYGVHWLFGAKRGTAVTLTDAPGASNGGNSKRLLSRGSQPTSLPSTVRAVSSTSSPAFKRTNDLTRSCPFLRDPQPDLGIRPRHIQDHLYDI